MEQKGDANRLTMEDQLQGKKLETDTAEPSVDDWVKTSYINDITLPYGQVLTETTAGKTTAYTYGVERINAQSSSLKTQYVYDGRGSVAQTVAGAPTTAATSMESFAYTPFGEQLIPICVRNCQNLARLFAPRVGSSVWRSAATPHPLAFATNKNPSRSLWQFLTQTGITPKVSGFGFNAEWYDAATGMQNLRARQYEPGMMRFGQKDLLRGSVVTPLSLNRYLYVQNDPVNLIDPSGHFAIAALVIGAAVIGAVVGGTVAYKAATVNNTVTEKAKTATEAAKDKQNEAYLDWYLYCQINYAFLSSTAKAEFDKARKTVGNVTPDTTLSQKQKDAILAACVAIVKAKEKEEIARLEQERHKLATQLILLKQISHADASAVESYYNIVLRKAEDELYNLYCETGDIRYLQECGDSVQLGSAALYIKVAYSKNDKDEIVLAPFRQSVYFIDGGINVDYHVNTQRFTTDGSAIFYDIEYSATLTVSVPLTLGEIEYTTEGGKMSGSFRSL